MEKLNLEKIEYKNHNERDVEIPVFIDLISKWAANCDSLLDVGATYSWYTYADQVRGILTKPKKYDGIDILPCEKTAAIIDDFIVGNFGTMELNPYDIVACISTIEHSGISTYQEQDYSAEQIKVFEKIVQVAQKAFYISCPFGMPGLYPNEYSNITADQLAKFEELASKNGFSTEAHFYCNEFPQGRLKWQLIDRKQAARIELRRDRGVQCVMLMAGEKL